EGRAPRGRARTQAVIPRVAAPGLFNLLHHPPGRDSSPGRTRARGAKSVLRAPLSNGIGSYDNKSLWEKSSWQTKRSRLPGLEISGSSADSRYWKNRIAGNAMRPLRRDRMLPIPASIDALCRSHLLLLSLLRWPEVLP